MNPMNINQLCEKYRSDKCPAIAHSYAPFYDKLFKSKKKTAKKILELGCGTPERMRHVKRYTLCASLFVWRDYFPNAMIYGFDNKEECNIVANRIQVIVGDANNTKDLQKVIDLTDGDFDIIVDDCSHYTKQQIESAAFFIPYMKDDGIYCIEDVRSQKKILDNLSQYNCKAYNFKPDTDDNLVVITK
jgi:SAM-dependent methyltransferase